MSFVRDLEAGRTAIEGNTLVRRDNAAPTVAEDAEWAREFGEQEETEADFLERMYADPQFEGADFAWANDQFMPVREGYHFDRAAEENPYTEEADPLQAGLRLFRDGRFAEAILAFEAAVARVRARACVYCDQCAADKPAHALSLQDAGNAEAWHYLGKCHQEGDRDGQAIAALTRAVEAQPDRLESYVDLAVSHTNNMQKDRAMAALEQWLRHNSKYSAFAPPPLDELLKTMDVETQLRAMYDRQDVLIDCFVQAAQTSPDAVDPAVQICLGLLYSLALEYDNASQCFKVAATVLSSGSHASQAALAKMPDDYALWNKVCAACSAATFPPSPPTTNHPVRRHAGQFRPLRGGAGGLLPGPRAQASVRAGARQPRHQLPGHEAVPGGGEAVPVRAVHRARRHAHLEQSGDGVLVHAAQRLAGQEQGQTGELLRLGEKEVPDERSLARCKTSAGTLTSSEGGLGERVRLPSAHTANERDDAAANA